MPIQFEISANDFAEATRQFFFQRKKAMVWGLTLYGALFLLFGLLMLFSDPALAIVPLACGTWFVLNFPVLVPKSARKMWLKTPTMHGLLTLSMGEDEVAVEGPNARFFYKWSVVQDFVEWPQGALLMLSPTSFWMFPRAAFSDEQWALLREKSLKTARPISNVAPIAEI